MIVGRTESLETLDRSLDAMLAGDGCVLLIEGSPGTGKTAMLGELTLRATARNLTVSRTMPQQSSPRPTVFVLDDAPLTTREYGAEVERVVHGVAGHAVMIALAVTPHRLDPAARRLLGRLRPLPYVDRLLLGTLDPESSCTLIRGVLPDATHDFCEECARLTGGNPFLLSEIVTWISAHHIAPAAGAAAQALEPVPPGPIRDFVAQQLDGLTPAAAAVIIGLANSDRPLALPEALARAEIERGPGLAALDQLIEAGLVRPGDPLSLTAALISHCLRAEAPAHHLLLAPPAGDAEVVDELLELADEELAAGKPDEATTLIRRALAEDSPSEDSKPRLLARLGQVDLLRGRSTSVGTLSAAAASLESSSDRADTLLTLGIAQVSTNALREATVAFDAAAQTADDASLVGAAQVGRALAGLFVPESREQSAAQIEQLGNGCEAPDERFAAAVELARAWVGLLEGSSRDAIRDGLERALELRGATPPVVAGYFDSAAATLCALLDDYPGALALCDLGAAGARSAGSVVAQRSVELARAMTLLHEGRLELAEARAAGLLERHSEQPVGLTSPDAILATVHHEHGDSERADQVALAALRSGVPESQRPSLLEACARAQLERGELAEALKTATEAASACRALGIANPAVVAWQPIAAICYAEAGDRVRARTIASDAHATAERFGGPRAIALTLRTRARLERPATGLRQLEQAREAIDDSGAELERARVLIEHGRALNSARRVRAARDALRDGIELADRLGARRLCRLGLVALREAGGRPRRARMTGPEALTPAERQVVELAGRGLSNPEIARKLVVTRKTVEWHLSRSYAKLDVRSRRQLPDVLSHASD